MKYLFLAVSILLLMGCSDVKDLKFSKDNHEQVMEKVKNSKGLTGEEHSLLMAALMQATISGQALEGKTVGTLIEEQKKIFSEIAKQEIEAKRLADEASKKEAEKAAELSKYIMVAPFKKSFQESDFMRGIFEDTIQISFVFENKGNKDIKAFRGTTTFKDIFGEKIKEIQLSYDEGIKAGQKINWQGTMEYNEFMDDSKKLRSTDLENIKFEWRPNAIIFADGTKLGLTE